MMQKLVIFLCFSTGFSQNGFTLTRANPQSFQFGDGFSLFVPRSINGLNTVNQVITTPRPQQTKFGHNQDSGGNQRNNKNILWTLIGSNQNPHNSNSGTGNGNLESDKDFHNNNSDKIVGNHDFVSNQNTENRGFEEKQKPSFDINFVETQNSDKNQLQPNNLVERTPSSAEGRQRWSFQPDDSCRAADQTIGSCINIKTCPQYLNLLSKARTNPQVVEVLKRSHCGFEGNDAKVCCPKSIPNIQPQTEPAQTPATISPVTHKPAPTEPPVTVVTSSEIRESDEFSQFVNSLPEPPVCGSSNDTASRIVGGRDAELGGFPWMALLGYHSKRSPKPRWQCGGSLVTNKHVLTAAHCIYGREDILYLVRLGELDLSRDDDGATPIDVPIKMKIKHEDYSPKSFTNDIGLLVLEHNVRYTDLIKPICLPKPARLRALTFERHSPLIAGWGDVEFHGPSAPHLQVLQLPVVSNEFCKNAYRNYKAQVIDERVLCAGFDDGGKDACQGDSGGPLMQSDYVKSLRQGYFYQIGVVSFGRKCAEAGYPGVYTRTTHFMPWLYKNIVGDSPI